MSDPRIEAALVAIENATPGPFAWYEHVSDSQHLPSESGLISQSGGGIVLTDDAGYWPELGSPDAAMLAIGASAIPAALRLAAAVEADVRDFALDGYTGRTRAALSAFLDSLPAASLTDQPEGGD